jgi:hypothetical protein
MIAAIMVRVDNVVEIGQALLRSARARLGIFAGTKIA